MAERTYSYNGCGGLTAGELYFLIVVDKILEQLGVQDVVAAALIISGQPILPTRVKIGGPTVTKGTSPASKYASKRLSRNSL